MKKCFCVLLAALIFAASFCFDVSVFAFEQSENIARTRLGETDTYYEFDADTKTLTVSGTGAMPDMKNSESSQPWYDWRSDGSIERVVIEEGITYVGNYCFYCVKANDFTLPNTLKTVGRYSFALSGISSVALPFGFTGMGSNAFDSCKSLVSVTLPDTLASISNYAFSSCTLLESVVIPYSVKAVGSYAFNSCSALNSAVFDDMTADITISAYAFYDCLSLLSVSFPSGATLKTKAFGLGKSGVLNGVNMIVYNSSNAHVYATVNSIPFQYSDDSYPLSLGVKGSVTYDANNSDKAYAFTFTPEVSGVYNFYSRGECDVKASLYSDSALLCESDDISDADRNFCISYELEQGTDYLFSVVSMGSEGTAELVIYPDEINSFDIRGSLTFDAEDGFRSSATAYFPIVNGLLSDFVLDVHFAGGFSDKIYYSAGYFDNRQISLHDTQQEHPFTCGENSESVAIGEALSAFPVYINHSYNKTVVPYTAYDDGYTVFTCMLCGDEYVGDYVESPAITVKGRILLATGEGDGYSAEYPLTDSTVEFCGGQYTPDETGWFSFKTLDSGQLVVKNPYCDDVTFTINNDYHDINYGVIALPAYDFNRDGFVNGRDLAYFKSEHQGRLGKNYFKYAVNFM